MRFSLPIHSAERCSLSTVEKLTLKVTVYNNLIRGITFDSRTPIVMIIYVDLNNFIRVKYVKPRLAANQFRRVLHDIILLNNFPVLYFKIRPTDIVRAFKFFMRMNN